MLKNWLSLKLYCPRSQQLRPSDDYAAQEHQHNVSYWRLVFLQAYPLCSYDCVGFWYLCFCVFISITALVCIPQAFSNSQSPSNSRAQCLSFLWPLGLQALRRLRSWKQTKNISSHMLLHFSYEHAHTHVCIYIYIYIYTYIASIFYYVCKQS